MCRERGIQQYTNFNELPQELKNKFNNDGKACCVSRKQKVFVEFINLLNKNGDKLIDGLYSGNTSKMKVQWHECGHTTEISWNNYKSGRGCGICQKGICIQGENDIATTHPHLMKYFINKEDGYNYTHKSSAYVKVVCPHCKTEKTMRISHLVNHGVMCTNCGDGISYPEKFVGLLLQELGLNIKKQFMFDGFKYRYDILVNDCIIEVHGIQHYIGWNGSLSYEQEHENDMCKYDLAVLHGYEYNKNYFVIDARESDVKWLKNSIEQCEFFNQLDLTNINWKDIDMQSQKSLKVEVCRYWNEKSKSNSGYTVGDLIKHFGIGRQTALRFLHWGTEQGLCYYNSQEHGKRRTRDRKPQPSRSEETKLKMSESRKGKPSKKRKPVICLETLQPFEDAQKAGEWCGVSRTAIGNYLNGYSKYAGKHPETSEKLHWMYYEDYLKLHENEGE